MSLNKNSVYCVMPRSSEPPDTCKWGGPKLRGILKFSLLNITRFINNRSQARGVAHTFQKCYSTRSPLRSRSCRGSWKPLIAFIVKIFIGSLLQDINDSLDINDLFISNLCLKCYSRRNSNVSVEWDGILKRDTNTNNNQMRETPRSPQGPNEKGRES